MIVITGTIRVEAEDDFLSVRDALIARTARSQNDKGNIEYAFSQDLGDPTVIHLIEKWEDEASLRSHLEIPDEEFSKVMENARIVSAVVTSYDAANEKVLMSRQ
jgi:quinol monooxygenase YgiN